MGKLLLVGLLDLVELAVDLQQVLLGQAHVQHAAGHVQQAQQGEAAHHFHDAAVQLEACGGGLFALLALGHEFAQQGEHNGATYPVINGLCLNFGT